MKFRTTLRLLTAVCVLGFVVWLVENRFRPGEPTGSGEKVLGIVSEAVNGLSITRGDFIVDCSRRDGKWFIDRPLRARADEGQVNRILNVLEIVQRDEIITVAQRLNRDLSLADYGLDPPRASFVLRGPVFRKELLIGCDSPLGESIYVKLNDGDSVMATSRSVLDIVPAEMERLRDRTVVYGEAARTHRLEIQRPGVGFIQLAQTESGWRIQQPIAARADQSTVTRMLDALYSLKVEKFVWDAQVNEKDSAAPDGTAGAQEELYDLVPDKAPARIGVWVARDRVGRELVLGKQVQDDEKLVYAKIRDVDSIYALDKAILEVFSVAVNDLRDRQVFAVQASEVKYACLEEGDKRLVLTWHETEGWLITEPVRWKADDHMVLDVIRRIAGLRVEAFHGKQTNLVDVGLAPPAYTMRLLTAAPTKESEPAKVVPAADGQQAAGRQNCLYIAAMNPKDTAVYAKLADDETVCTLRAGPVHSLVAGLTDPLLYRDRSVLAVPVTSVIRISQTKSGVRQEVTRGESGEWAVSSPATNVVDAKVVEDILFHAANMRALRIESHNPESLAIYGLDRPTLVLTLGLAGDQGIQKSLMMGFRAKTDGIYAMVQGRDVVFVLSNELVDEMMRDVSAPPPGRQKSGPADESSIGPTR